MVTWNVQSWYRTGAANSAIQQLEKIDMDIVAVQELSSSGNLKIRGSVVFFRGNQYGRHEGGTGFVIKCNLRTMFCDLNP